MKLLSMGSTNIFNYFLSGTVVTYLLTVVFTLFFLILAAYCITEVACRVYFKHKLKYDAVKALNDKTNQQG